MPQNTSVGEENKMGILFSPPRYLRGTMTDQYSV